MPPLFSENLLRLVLHVVSLDANVDLEPFQLAAEKLKLSFSHLLVGEEQLQLRERRLIVETFGPGYGLVPLRFVGEELLFQLGFLKVLGFALFEQSAESVGNGFQGWVGETGLSLDVWRAW